MTTLNEILDKAIEKCIVVMGNKALQGSYAAPREVFRDILRQSITEALEATRFPEDQIELMMKIRERELDKYMSADIWDKEGNSVNLVNVLWDMTENTVKAISQKQSDLINKFLGI